jgi:hypothetical protein
MTRSNNIFNSHPIRIPVAARESFMESRLPFEVLICRRPEVFPAISHWLIACNGKGCAQAASLAVSQAGEARAFAARSKAI